MRRRNKTSLVAISFLVATAAFAQSADQGTDVEAIDFPMSKEIAYYTFMETVGRVQVYVSGQLAGLEQAQAVVPFQIAVAVSGKGPELEISPLNFEFHDAYGEVYQTSPLADVKKTGLEQFVPQWVAENPMNLGGTQVNSRPVASKFYPTTESELTHTYLDQETYLIDVIYFPRPKDLHGELMMSFFTKGMTEGAINVRFKVPPGKEKSENATKKKTTKKKTKKK